MGFCFCLAVFVTDSLFLSDQYNICFVWWAAMDRDLWLRVYTVYQKDPSLLSRWVDMVVGDLDSALEFARRYTTFDVAPDTLLLGFSPQILLAVVSVNNRGVRVVTSPEVWVKPISPAMHSYRLLRLLVEKGLVEKVYTASFAPSPEKTPVDVIKEIEEAVRQAEPGILDISGGTQLAAIAASRTVSQLTYIYPLGDRVHIFKL